MRSLRLLNIQREKEILFFLYTHTHTPMHTFAHIHAILEKANKTATTKIYDGYRFACVYVFVSWHVGICVFMCYGLLSSK